MKQDGSRASVGVAVDKGPNAVKAGGLRVKTQIRAGGVRLNHNEARFATKPSGLRVKTRIRAGRIALNHNETQ